MICERQKLEAAVTGYTSEGLGVCRVEDMAVFVPGVIAGERVRIRIRKVLKSYALADAEEILEPSPHRVRPTCKKAAECGGCAFLHMDYEEELRLKAERVTDAMNRIGGEALDTVPITGSPALFGYRNKAQFPVAQLDGKPEAGFFAEHTHRVVPVKNCRIQCPQANAARETVTAFLQEKRIPAYDEKTGSGLVRHVYVRTGKVSGEVLVCLVLNGDSLPGERELAERLKKEVPGFATLVINENRKRGNTVLGEKYRTVCGAGTIEDTLCGLRFRLSPASFYQINHDQAEQLYGKALEFAALTGKETVLDLYCGTGTITLCLAGKAGKAIGVEIIPAAIRDAAENARRNGIGNAEFFCADAGEAAVRFASEGTRPDVIVVDPPRKGLSGDVIDAMLKMDPDRIVYVSCDPATLARDVKLLKQRYSLTRIEAFDMFPRCAHVETVVLLSQQRPNDKIRVELDLTEFDITAAEKEATYQKIKDYILEKHGVKVSSLYIAQVKEKLGIKERENYNLPKNADSKQPQCPKEKEKMIVEALKNFKMI